MPSGNHVHVVPPTKQECTQACDAASYTRIHPHIHEVSLSTHDCRHTGGTAEYRGIYAERTACANNTVVHRTYQRHEDESDASEHLKRPWKSTVLKVLVSYPQIYGLDVARLRQVADDVAELERQRHQ